MKRIFFFFCLLSVNYGYSQEDNNTSKISSYFQLDYFYGNVLAQDGVEHLATGNPEGFLLSWNRRTFGEKTWQQEYNYPDYGFSFGYQDYKNNSLAETYALFAHYNFYLFDRQATNKLVLSLGIGLAYNTNPYDKVTNNKNVSLGSHLNSSSFFRLYYYRQNILKNLGVQAGLSLFHASNASFKAPNKGINTWGLNVGLNYDLNPEEDKKFIVSEIKEFQKQPIRFNAVVMAGINQSDYINTGTFPFLVLSGYADKRINSKSALQLGADFHLHYYLKEYIKSQAIFNLDVEAKDQPDFKRASIFVGHELYVNSISFLTQIGYYVYSPFDGVGLIYERVGVKKYFSENMFSSITVKVHLFNAEALEFGFGYRF